MGVRKNIIVSLLLSNLPHIVESESLLPYLQEPTSGHNLSQINPICTLPSCFHTFNFSIVLHLVYGFQVSLFSSFFHQNLLSNAFHMFRVPHVF